MTFAPDDYGNDAALMWEDIRAFIAIILRNRYLCVIKQEDFGIVVIEYQHDEATDTSASWGCAQPVWLTPQQGEVLSAIEGGI